jgi:hypothetical protein
MKPSSILGALLGFLLVLAVPVDGQVRYVDENEVTHWVSSFEQIPERYREKVLETDLDRSPFFERGRARKPGEPPAIKWELIQRDFEDNGNRLVRRVLASNLQVAECIRSMEATVAQDPWTARGRVLRTKSGKGVGVVHQGYREASVRVWQCVEQE